MIVNNVHIRFSILSNLKHFHEKHKKVRCPSNLFNIITAEFKSTPFSESAIDCQRSTKFSLQLLIYRFECGGILIYCRLSFLLSPWVSFASYVVEKSCYNCVTFNFTFQY